MKALNRSLRPWSRLRSMLAKGGERLSRAAGFARSVDSAPTALLEQLEERQLLFALEITPDLIDPQTGVGTVQAFFGYAIPNLFTTFTPQPQDPDVRVEEFTDETRGNVFSGRVLLGSLLQISHTITPPPNIRIWGAVNPTTGQPLPDTNELFVQMANGQSMIFRTAANAPNPLGFMGMQSFTVDIRAPLGTPSQGLNLANFRVILRFQGEEVGNFTGSVLGELNTTAPGTGIGTFVFASTNPSVPLFDEIEFLAIGTPIDPFAMDNIQTVLPPGDDTALVESRLFGAWITFTGPLGATIELFDLYLRPMRQTIAVGRPPSGNVVLIDPDDDGVPNFNDGIGKIVMTGTDERAALTVVGGTLTSSANQNAIFTQNGFSFIPVNNLEGIYGAFEQAGYGFRINPQSNQTSGLPPGPGSVIIGSPYNRDNSSAPTYNPYGLPTSLFNFNFVNPDQGIKILDGSNMGTIFLHGVLHGSSKFNGFLDSMYVGYLPGSVAVRGDLGSLIVGSDAGVWEVDSDFPNLLLTFRSDSTGAQLVVERTLGEFMCVGRMGMDVTVRGDLNSPVIRPARDVLNYFEREHPYEINRAGGTVQATFAALIANNGWKAQALLNKGTIFRKGGQNPIVGNTFLRNDAILSAEWVGSIGTATQIHGNLGGGDPVHTADDDTDVYSFASDGTGEIVMEITSGFASAFTNTFLGVNARIVDNQGRVIASSRFDDRALQVGLANNSLSATVQQIRFTPDAPGVYYLVLIRAINFVVSEAIEFDYLVTMNGLASATAGLFRTAASLGSPNADEDASITLLSGSVGSIHVGTGIVVGNGNEVDPILSYNDEDESDQRMEINTVTVSIPGRLYSITCGGDIEGTRDVIVATTTFIIGGDFGTLTTGLSEVIGVGPSEGDVGNVNLLVGGRIALIDIKGAIAVDQDAADPQGAIIGPVTIRSGTSGGNGDIGMIRVGEHVRASFLTVVTSPGSTIGAFLVGQDALDDDSGFVGIYDGDGADFFTNFGSDVRFVDFAMIDEFNTPNAGKQIIGGQTLVFTDDGGGTVQIQITGVPSGVVAGFVRVLPIDGSQGVAIAQIEADLTGGRALVITSQAPSNQDDVISIGRINILGGDAGSAVRIQGPGHVDVWQINQLGGDTFGEIINETPLGDIVAIDVAGLTRLSIEGNLGRTQSKGWGPRLIGPFLGVSDEDQSDVRDALGITGVMSANWNGELNRPIDETVFDPAEAFLSDIGSPFSPFLNGLAVRDGNVTDVFVGGAVGDVLILGGNLTQLVVNTDFVTPFGGFDGILGVVYAAADVVLVRVGDGIARRVMAPFGATGVFAGDDVHQVTGNVSGAPSVISGMIVASNTTVEATANEGIVLVSLPSGGDFIDAHISVEQLDGWFIGTLPFDNDVNVLQTGSVEEVSGTGADFFRSRIFGIDINDVSFTDGVWDASLLSARRNVGVVRADHFRNSTLQGQDPEFAPNVIIAGQDLDTVLAGLTGEGDISDLQVDILGSILTSVSARVISRLILDVDRTIELLEAGLDLRASNISAGTLVALNAGRNIRTCNINLSGPIIAIDAGDSITNTRIFSNGPDARIDSIFAVNLITGEIAAAGPIASVTVEVGDFEARVTTTTVRGNVGALSAGRDLDIVSDISGDASLLTAGRHIGRLGAVVDVILVRGNLENLSAPNGQLYSDIRIGQSLIGSAVIGPAFHTPAGSNLGDGTIVAFGRIQDVRINGDFAGKIISYSNGIGAVVVTNGSTLPNSLIAAYDGDIQNVVINNGHLLGDVHADYILYFVTVNAAADGVFGDIGVNPDLNPNVLYDQRRTQLPLGVFADAPIQGPSITAGHNIGRITTSNGSIFEAFIYAGRALGTVSVTGDVRNDPFTSGTGTVIASGSSMFTVNVSGNLMDTAILAGVKSFGDDGRPGGVNGAADTNHLGKIGNVNVAGGAFNVGISAGFFAGDDGLYNTADDAIVPGLSFVRNVLIGGTISNVSAWSDFPIQQVTPGVIVGGLDAPPMDPRIAGGIPPGGVQATAGTPLPFTTASGEAGTILYTGPGRVYWDATNNRVVLISTRADTNLTISAANGALTNFYVVSNDESSMGEIRINANLLGESGVVVDNNIVNLQVNNAAGNPQFLSGGNTRFFTIGNMSGGSVGARFGRTVTVVGNFGVSSADDEIVARYLALGDMFIGGQHSGDVIVERDAFSFTVGGAMVRGVFRSGSDLGAFTAGSLSESRVSVRDSIGSITVHGDVFDTSIQAGGDLGEDGRPGGAGFNADQATTGFIGDVSIGGNFLESDIVAGMLRGPDGFFGTTDDSLAAGRSTIGNVSIAGTAFGSNLLSEQYRISSTGTLGSVTAAGIPPSNSGNLKVLAIPTAPLPIVVEEIRVIADAGIFKAHIFFNQPMDSSTIAAALRIQEVREGGQVFIDVLQGPHYTVEYNSANNSAIVSFQRSVTERNLPQGGSPGPGVYRFEFDGAVLRAAVVDARLDGNGDGFADPAGDDYSADTFVGDAGDKLADNIVPAPPHRVDFYGASDLDLVLDNNRFPDTLPDVNRLFTIRGAIGDHPDTDPDFFGFSGDLDVYKITLRAGQILQLGAMQGSALFTGVALFNAQNAFQGGDTADSLILASDVPPPGELTVGTSYLIKTTGTYYIVVGNAPFAYSQPDLVLNIPPIGGGVGDYNFSVRVFDDADTGFAGDTDSGNGQNLPTPPNPIAFAGPDQIFGTPDDFQSLAINEFVFTLDRGQDQIAGTVDDVVNGTNGSNISIRRSDVDRITTIVNSAIGTPGHVGVPGDEFEPDADVYRLNNGLAIAPGTAFRITVKLSETGADLGSRGQNSLISWNDEVQFGIFEITNSNSVIDGQLVFSPTDFLSSGGTPGTIAATAPFSYGYDENGDFFINFIAPGTINSPNTLLPASYALYIQGVFNTDYTLEIVQQGSGSYTRPRQNVFIETRGGEVDWLEIGGLVTEIGAFNASSLGFSGSINGQPVQTYILNRLVSRLTTAFNAAGVDVVISTNPNAFEFQDFSTVFLSSSNDPIGFFNERTYGATEHSDPFNADPNDEAVVFVPAFGLLGFTPAQADVNRFVDSVTAAVGRRIGELIGLRMTIDDGGPGGDILASNSPENFGSGFSFVSEPRNLSGRFDLNGEGDFFLGQQSSVQLLQKWIRP